MKKNKQILLVCYFAAIIKGSIAQIYPADFLMNGCSYTYNGLSFTPVDSLHLKKGDFHLVFEDDFENNTLDTGKWISFYPWIARSLHNGDSGTGWEQQYYSDQNVTIDSGILHLSTIVDPGYRAPDPYFSPSTNVFFKYTSGMICSKLKFKEGRFEVRCKIPRIEGVWPAFWLLGDCAQEIDGFEFTSKNETSLADADSRNIIMSYHKWNYCQNKEGGQCDRGFTRDMGIDLSEAFHVYSVEWDENKIIWQVDNKNVREVYRIWKISSPLPVGPMVGYAQAVKDLTELDPDLSYTVFNTFPTKDNSMNLILNTAVSYDRGDYPKEFLIDYVKVFTKADTVQSFQRPEDFNHLTIYPNPTQGFFLINQTFKEKPITHIRVINHYGEQLICPTKMETTTATVDLSSLPKGIYFIEIIYGGTSIFKKIVRE